MVIFDGQSEIPILTYHSVDNSGSVISITPVQFREQMMYLRRRGYQTMTLQNMLKYSKENDGTVPPKTIVLTFDDGFMNNYESAFPILQDCGMTATIFVVTDLVGSVCAWGKDEGFPETPLMSWNEIDEMHRYGIDIQPHSCTHPCLPSLHGDQIFNEVFKCRQVIEQRLGKDAKVFCYPYGKFNDEVIAALKRAGYIAAVTTMFGRNRRARNCFKLKRIGSAHFANRAKFRLVLHPSYELYIQLKTAFIDRFKNWSLEPGQGC